MNATNGGIDFEIDLTSMDSNSVDVNNVSAGVASQRINQLILGGAEITDALVGTFTLGTGSTTQDVTVVSGFGQPDLIFFFALPTALSDTAVANSSITFGWGIKGQNGRCVSIDSTDAAGTQDVRQVIRNNRCFHVIRGATNRVQARLDTTTANWPTDGFRLLYDANPTNADPVAYLALKGTFTKTDGEGSIPTAGGLPVVQNLNHGSTPKGLFIAFTRQTTANSVDSTTAEACGLLGLGSGDGTNEGFAALMDQDNAGTSNANNFHSATKIIQNRNVLDETVTSEADHAISGNDVQLSWTDIDTSAWLYEWLTLGDAVAAPTAPHSLVQARHYG
jgi:hypothetical protein